MLRKVSFFMLVQLVIFSIAHMGSRPQKSDLTQEAKNNGEYCLSQCRGDVLRDVVNDFGLCAGMGLMPSFGALFAVPFTAVSLGRGLVKLHSCSSNCGSTS